MRELPLNHRHDSRTADTVHYWQGHLQGWWSVWKGRLGQGRRQWSSVALGSSGEEPTKFIGIRGIGGGTETSNTGGTYASGWGWWRHGRGGRSHTPDVAVLDGLLDRFTKLLEDLSFDAK